MNLRVQPFKKGDLVKIPYRVKYWNPVIELARVAEFDSYDKDGSFCYARIGQFKYRGKVYGPSYCQVRIQDVRRLHRGRPKRRLLELMDVRAKRFRENCLTLAM